MLFGWLKMNKVRRCNVMMLCMCITPIQAQDALDELPSMAFLEYLAEMTEIDTLIEKGTYDIVDLPPGATELDSMFQYKLKTCDTGQVVKRKALLCTRGDQQTKDKYDKTLAPTSWFATLRLIMSLACQCNLTLKHWDIKGAFLCADIDKATWRFVLTK